jgi:single-stranded DNA-binding protein
MSLYILASGALISDPQGRAGAKGPFTTATIRANGDEAALVSVIAFGDEANRLLQFVKGDALAVSGRARLTSWTGHDGTEKRGISVVAEQIAAAKPRPRSAAGRTRIAAAPSHDPSARPHRPRAAPRRSLYSAPKRPGRAAPDPPNDHLDDLYR